MYLRKFSDFNKVEKEENIQEEEVKQIVEEQKAESKPEYVKEEVLLNPETSNIEILEDKIIKFNTGHIKDILETIKTNYSDIDYYIRKKDNELHIVKYNEKLNLNINEFINSLLKFYSTKRELKNILEGIKVKGNNNFSIIENMKTQYNQKFIGDLTKLLINKK
jgi:hypothetical protein